MKFIVLLVLIITLPYDLHCQSTDSLARISYQEIIKEDSVDSINLLNNAKEWIARHQFKDVKSDSNKLTGAQSFLVYQKNLASEQIHGRIDYTVTIEVKNNKYRYTFTNFVFNYYKQNRNYKMEPSGKTKPLEDKKAPGWEKTWAKHKSYTTEQIQHLITDLKKSMAVMPIVSEKKSKKAEEEF